MKDTPTPILKKRLVELTKKQLELADENSEHWYNLLNEWELLYRPKPKAQIEDEELKKEFYDRGKSLTVVVQDFETKIIIHTLDECRWKKTEAAKILGITRRILSYKMKQLGINNDNSND
jgi:DNA-binding NtrC family response regulator